MSIIITVTESTNQIVSGIPEFVTISTNIPSIVFYTLDQSDPSLDSLFVEGDTLYLPTSNNSVYLKLLAVSGSEYSDIFEHEWKTTVPYYTKRFESSQGINILPPGVEVVDHLSVTDEGVSARETSIEFVDLEIQASSRDKYKKYEKGKTSIDFINFNLELLLSEEVYQSKTSSPNNSNLDFDPKAGLIIIDGSSPEKMRSQSVKIINRPNDTLAPRSEFYTQRVGQEPAITANLVKHYINPKTGKIVFYYFDSRECRWVQSIQQITPKILDIGQLTGNPRVFSWIQDPIMSKII
jgi:hypothetical protein